MATLLLHDIGLRPAQVKAIEKKARTAGTTAAEYVRLLLERELLADQSFDEILRPVRADFQKKGIREADVDALVRRARKAVTRVRKPRS